MKKAKSLIINLFLSSTLFWGVPTVEADTVVVKEPAEAGSYCHMKFPEMRPETLSWGAPVLGTERIVDFYGPCDYDPTGIEEIKVQRRQLLRGIYGEGD